jgi:sugar/nucleoside kinase (ribokinase family)
MKFIPGGSAANIASNLSMLSIKGIYIGVIGNDFSATICLDDLKKRNVDVSNVIQTDKDSTAFSVILKTEWGRDRSILAYKGANNLIKPSDIKEEVFKNIDGFAWTSITSENGCEAINKAITLTKKVGKKVFAAPSMSIIKHNPEWAKILISKSNVVSFNKEEASEFTKKSSTIDILNKIYNMGVEIVSITDGANGSTVFDGNQMIRTNIFKTSIKDTTGAGDAFMSGIIVSLFMGFSLPKLCKIATAMSALECSEIGVREGIPNNISALEDFINKNEVEQTISKINI